jgi:hypothetical protein
MKHERNSRKVLPRFYSLNYMILLNFHITFIH